ncbi:MAG: hypothetical protein AseanaTS_04740 [Candidatus Pelagadaptatus aseana]|uniref:VWA domain-containing protein n=1 Tax=Candidatus Pelagadaptatus aseana TaxID=3120508 RepID=UPI0039B262A8
MKGLWHWVIVSMGMLAAVSAWSQAAVEENSLAIVENKPSDVRVVIDVSGSMKQNDPSNLRKPALELLVKLLPEDSKAGVWTFGKYINMLVPHRPVTESWRDDAMDKSAEINSVGLFTNIGEAIEKATYDNDKLSGDYDTSLILLTDGMVDVDKDPEKNQAEWRRIVDEVLPQLQESGYTVHTIALSDNADKALLDKLAVATDGVSEVAEDADELLKIFLRVFDQAAPTEQVPLTENTFLVDSSIEEFTALIFRSSAEPTQLVSPDKTEYRFDKEEPDVSWYKTDQYDLITVKRPLEGEWQVLADIEPDSRVSIVSNLKLLVKPLPSNLFIEEETRLSLLLQDNKNTVTDPEFLGLLDIDSLVLNQTNGREWSEKLSKDSPPANGIYSQALDMFREEGRYNVSVLVDGKSFQRQFNHPITVRVPFETELEKLILGGSEKQLVKVRAHSQLVEPDQTQVVARIKDPKGRSAIKPLTLNAADEWELLLEPDTEGVYQVRLRISGIDKEGGKFDVDPETITFSFPSEDNPFQVPVIDDVVPEPVTELVQETVPEAIVEPKVEPKPVPAESVAKPEPPKADPEPVADAVEPEAEEESSNWPLYVGLGVGNILIVVLAFFAYRAIMGGSGEDALEELEKQIDEETKPIEKDAPDAEPDMDASAGEDLDQATDGAAIDLASEEIKDEDIPDLNNEAQLSAEADELLAGLQDPDGLTEEPDLIPEPDMAEEPEDDGPGFSLDDFSPDSLDDLIDNGDEKDKD